MNSVEMNKLDLKYIRTVVKKAYKITHDCCLDYGTEQQEKFAIAN